MLSRLPSLLLVALALAGSANASDTIALSAEAREAAIEAGATRAADERVDGAGGRRIHGEMGVEMGSGGYSAVYGTAVVPLSDSATAAVSFVDSRGPRWSGRR